MEHTSVEHAQGIRADSQLYPSQLECRGSAMQRPLFRSKNRKALLAYSSRNASAGLTRSARLAGATNAATDAAMTVATTTSRVTGSSGFTP